MAEIIRKAEIAQVRKMAREIKKKGDAGFAHFLSVADLTKDDTKYELLEDSLDILQGQGVIVYSV